MYYQQKLAENPHTTELTEQELYRIYTPAFEVVQQRLQRDFDTSFDRFLYDYVGDPFDLYDTQKAPEKIRAGYCFDWREDHGWTDSGALIHLRRSSNGEILDMRADGTRVMDPKSYYVATSDLYEGNTVEWHVMRAEISRTHHTQLYLSEDYLEEAPVPTVEFGSLGVIEGIKKSRELARQNEAYWHSKPQVVFGPQTAQLKLPGRESEDLHSMSELVRQINANGLHIAKTILQETIEAAPHTAAA